MFLKEKHDGSIKARGCADGCSQRDYMTKNETRSAYGIPRGNDAIMHN